MSHEQLYQGTDPDRVEHSSQSERAAEQPTGEHYGRFDPGAGQPNRPPGPVHEAGHQSVSGPRPHSGTDVERGGECVDHDPRHHRQCSNHDPVEIRQHRGGRIHGERDHHDVAHGSQARALAQRYPHQEHHHSGDRGDGSETEREMAFETLVEYIPRIDAEAAGDHQRHRRPVQPQTHVEGNQSRGQPPTDDRAKR